MSSSLEGVSRKVGDPVWVFDENRREYRPGQAGPIWRAHWIKKEITGETSRSWVIGRGAWEAIKIPKKGPQPHGICWSEEEIERRAFVHDHTYRISEKVHRINDYDTLKKIADLVGYEAQS